ncbi:hypothetical protein PHACT_07555 [Pseudohongiella acticola]|uniref:DUF1249 domain-containing protein n=1 Tax=Pseudohongiella acticola TaxID=1524254 RepID=A0A1E8CL35_9GAMM|nr:DUF1249 domain-containing protein [Pseudohongiella acticola]OFE13012.1 hypothetical protein PHACT_07555 [Pseudohongiella acticola]
MSEIIDKVSERSRYRVNLADYMATCDANYIRLLTLIPALESERAGGSGKLAVNQQNCDLDDIKEWEFLIGSGGRKNQENTGRPPIRVKVSRLEAFAYTSTLEIQVQSGFPAWSPAPVIVVRMYHDANTAEPISFQGHRQIPARCAVPNVGMYHQDEKRQINEFLAEWLRLCLSSGISARTADFLCTE